MWLSVCYALHLNIQMSSTMVRAMAIWETGSDVNISMWVSILVCVYPCSSVSAKDFCSNRCKIVQWSLKLNGQTRKHIVLGGGNLPCLASFPFERTSLKLWKPREPRCSGTILNSKDLASWASRPEGSSYLRKSPSTLNLKPKPEPLSARDQLALWMGALWAAQWWYDEASMGAFRSCINPNRRLWNLTRA